MKQEHNRVPPQSRNPTVAQSHGEMLRQLRNVALELQKVAAQSEGYRRLLWLIIHEQKGVTLHEDAYRAMKTMGPDDCAFKLLPDPATKMVHLVECDREGKDISLIITPDAAPGKIIVPP